MRADGTLAELLRLLRDDADRHVRVHLAVALVLVGASGLLAALAPLALKSMVDAVAGGAPSGEEMPGRVVLAFGAAYVLALCGGRLLADLGPLLTGAADQRLDRRLTGHFFDHLLSLPMAYLLRRRSGALLRSLDLASAGCRVIVLQVVTGLVPALVETAAMAVVLHRLGQPSLVLAFAGTACLYLAVFATGARRLAQQASQVSDAHLELHALLADSLQHSETLRCFVAEPVARQRIGTASGVLETHWLALHRLRTRIALAITATFTLSVASSLWLAGDAVAKGALTVGGFVLANVYMLQLVRPLEMLGAAARDIAQSLGFVRPLLDILREPTEMTEMTGATAAPTEIDTTAPTRLPGTGPAVRFENITFGYDPLRPVIRGLDLDIPAGSTVAIVGASGSGKSSLVRLLLRLYRPQSGRILMDGLPIDALSAADLRTRIGLVPQDTALFHDSIASNIGLGRHGADAVEIARAAGHAQLHPFIAGLPTGYATLVGERGLQISGGERQRIAIARAVLGRPDLFVFDEATSMLDSRTEAALLRDLHAVTAGRTTIIIAHRLSTVKNADDIVVLDQGRVAERGGHAELLHRAGLYAHLWHQQMRGTP